MSSIHELTSASPGSRRRLFQGRGSLTYFPRRADNANLFSVIRFSKISFGFGAPQVTFNDFHIYKKAHCDPSCRSILPSVHFSTCLYSPIRIWWDIFLRPSTPSFKILLLTDSPQMWASYLCDCESSSKHTWNWSTGFLYIMHSNCAVNARAFTTALSWHVGIEDLLLVFAKMKEKR